MIGDTMSRGSVGCSTIAIVIINYNTQRELQACLESLRGDVTPIIVFDNASSDGSIAMVNRDFPAVTVIESSGNLGYGAAANRAISGCSCEYILLCNSDVIFERGVAAKLSDYLDRHPDTALAGPRLMNPDHTLQRSCLPFPGSIRWALDNDVAAKWLRFIPGLRRSLLRTCPHAIDRLVPFVKGAVMAIRRRAFQEVNGFDESFFMYYEEADLCRRLAQRGWQVRFTPSPTLFHLGAASTSKARTDMAVEQFVSLMRFARRHYGSLHCVLLLGVWKVILFLRLIRDHSRLIRNRNERMRQAIEADLVAWRRALLWSFAELRGTTNNPKL